MTGKSRLGLLAFLLIALARCNTYRERPAPPAGYRWTALSAVHTSLLIPDGWHFRWARDGRAISYYAARHDFDDSRAAQVGLTVMVMPRLTDRNSVKYSQEFIEAACHHRESFNVFGAGMSPLVGNGCFASDEGTMMYTLMLANPITNTLYQVIFHAPEGEWKTVWPVGETMIRSLQFDPKL